MADLGRDIVRVGGGGRVLRVRAGASTGSPYSSRASGQIPAASSYPTPKPALEFPPVCRPYTILILSDIPTTLSVSCITYRHADRDLPLERTYPDGHVV